MRAVFSNRFTILPVSSHSRRFGNDKLQKPVRTKSPFKVACSSERAKQSVTPIPYHTFTTCDVCGNDFNVMYEACTHCTGVELLKTECDAEMIDHSLQLL